MIPNKERREASKYEGHGDEANSLGRKTKSLGQQQWYYLPVQIISIINRNNIEK